MTRRAKPLTAEQKAVIASVRRISKQRTRINESYIAAVINAREAGVTYAAIAEAAGTSSQAAQEIVRRHTIGLPGGSIAEPSTNGVANQIGTGDSDITGGASGVLSDTTQGAAAVANEVGTQKPTE